MRTIRGQFNGGTLNEEVDGWMGDKRRLMIELGFALSDGEYEKTEITHLLGPPDKVVRDGDWLFDLIISLQDCGSTAAAKYEFLVYYWRGMHDFLFFTCQDGVIISSGWWYAGD